MHVIFEPKLYSLLRFVDDIEGFGLSLKMISKVLDLIRHLWYHLQPVVSRCP